MREGWREGGSSGSDEAGWREGRAYGLKEEGYGPKEGRKVGRRRRRRRKMLLRHR